MADFRRWFYAFAVVALLAGLTIPASAQGLPVTCNTNASVPTIVRAEAYADFVGDYVLTCTGGTPTLPGQVVPQVNLTIFLTTNITSKLTSGGLFDEALLIIDEPNTPGANATRPILNCGNTGAPDSGISGPGVCSIIAPPYLNAATGTPNPALTYDGTQNAYTTTAAPNVQATCGGGGGAPVVGTYGCGRPNIFQGRLGNAQNTGQANIVVFAGVPFDPPGTLTTRTLRITNVRADAEFTGVSSTFTQAQIQMNVSFTGTTLVSVNNPQQIVAYVQRGLIPVASSTGGTFVSNLGFLQCNTENGKLFGGTGFAIGGSTGGGTSGGSFNTGGLYSSSAAGGTPVFRFQEGFNTSWKTKNIAFVLAATGNGSFSSGAGYVYNGTTLYPSDLAQNVPGSNYNTESGFEWNSTTPVPSPNPPNSVGTNNVLSNGLPLASQTTYNIGSVNTGINQAGVANQGTRLALSFSNIPTGANIYVPPVLYLYRQNDGTGTTSFAYKPNFTTGVMVLTATDANGDTAYSALTSSGNLQQVSNNLAVYEILFTDPNSLEQVDVPVVVAYVSNLTSNAPVGLPVPGQIAQAAGSFAPFYSTSAARLPSSTLPVPRFIPGSTPLNLFSIVKCACDILFPFVASTGGFDTGIAIANTSLDPGATYGFAGTPQQGAVQFWYYGTGANGAAAPASQTSGIVPAGQVLTYVLSTGGGAIGTNPNGVNGAAMTNVAAGFEGYIIAQAGFQWCHGFAFISPLGGGPTSAGVSEGYLGIIVDAGPALLRTGQAAEIKAH